MVKSKIKKAKRRTLTNAQKIWCWENNSHICNICGKEVLKISETEFDHSRAFIKGGNTDLSNVKITHRFCNRLKGKKSLSEARKLLGVKSTIKLTIGKKPTLSTIQETAELVKEASEKLDLKFSHVEAWLFYPPNVSWKKKLRDPKKIDARSKLVVLTDLRKAYRVGNYVMNLILEDKIRWHSDDEQDLKEWCKGKNYMLIDKDATEDDLLEPYFRAEIIDKKEKYQRGEMILFETNYRGGLVNGFFDNEIIFPNGRNTWSWSPETIRDSLPGTPGNLNGLVNKKSKWSWTIPQDAPSGKYRVFMRVYNHFGAKNRPIAQQKEDSFQVA